MMLVIYQQLQSEFQAVIRINGAPEDSNLTHG
jgi:hypothetical protein